MNIYSSPQPEAGVPLPSETGSETFTEDAHASQGSTNSKISSQDEHYQFQTSAVDDVKYLDDRVLSPIPINKMSKVTEEMKASWQAKCAKLTISFPSKRTGDVRTSSQLSRLPTIADEVEEPEMETVSESGSLAFAITDPLPVPIHPGLRRRKLSLSPTLASIPEASRDLPFIPLDLTKIDKHLGPQDSDSNTESSMGIFEHHAEDFLYDSLSDTERCQTPLTYLSAGEFPDDDDDDGNEESCSEGSFSCKY